MKKEGMSNLIQLFINMGWVSILFREKKDKKIFCLAFHQKEWGCYIN
jgi:hypothetical protein